jgi:nitroreductase
VDQRHGSQSAAQDADPSRQARITDNPTLDAIRQRRSTHQFLTNPVTEEQVQAILEAGRWAPSALNSQPWAFVVVTDPQTRQEISEALQAVTLAWKAFSTAPALIVVAVDPDRDPRHFVEAGAIAAQNMCLAAHSIGLASSWAGIYTGSRKKAGAERDLTRLLSLPATYRVVAVIPIGTAARPSRSTRRPLEDIVHRDRFHPVPPKDPED